MANVLVLIDHHDHTPTPSAGPLLGVAARFGTPVAVAVTDGGDPQPLVDKLGSLGAAHVHLVSSSEAGQEIGRASCRERGWRSVADVGLEWRDGDRGVSG